MARKLENLRNIGVIAHIDAGKTTVTERMLFYSGAKHRVGQVDKGTTETDIDPEEQERGITIYSACVTFPWKDIVVNLLDTPGHVDFTAEVERCLRVLDGGVVVFSAREGVEAQSETVWRQADKYGVPRIAFINKMDREGADFEATIQEMRDRLSANPVAIQIPVGAGPAHAPDPFRGVIDLISMKMLAFDPATDGREISVEPIPESVFETASRWRDELLESLYGHSNELIELALQEEDPIPEELMHRVLREATIERQLQPVLCGSALHGIGVQPVLDAVARYLPSPAEVPAVQGRHPTDRKKTEKRNPTPKDPFSGLVFKILPAKTGDLYWVRIYSGELKANSRVYNPVRDKKENVSQLWQIHATKKEKEGQLQSAGTGDIVGVIGPRHSITGDTLCDTKRPIELDTINFPETVISMAIEPESSAERKKLGDVLEMMKRQDPTFLARENEETGQTIISGMGELHLEVIKHRLLRDFNVNVKVHKPRVNYRETVEKSVEVMGQCHRQVGGQQLFARVKIRMEPATDESAHGVIDGAVDSPSPEYRNSARDELLSRLEGGGVIGGFQLAKIRVTLLEVESQEDATNDTAVRIAAGDAFEQALRDAGPVLLEPIMRLEVSTPEDSLGEFVSDLQQRRAVIARTETRGNLAIIEANAPLSELFGYSGAMRSLSQGRASCSMEPLEYAPAPQRVAEAFAL